MALDKMAFGMEVRRQRNLKRVVEDVHAKKEIGRRLVAEAGALDLTATAAADMAGCSRRTWFSYESGDTTPDAVMLRRLDELGFDVQFLVTGRRSRRRSYRKSVG